MRGGVRTDLWFGGKTPMEVTRSEMVLIWLMNIDTCSVHGAGGA